MNLPKKAIVQVLLSTLLLTGGGFYAERLWSYESQCRAYEDSMVVQGKSLLYNVEVALDKHLAASNTLDRILNLPELLALSIDVERVLQEGRDTADEYEAFCGTERVNHFWHTDTRIDELRTRASNIGERYRTLGLIPPFSPDAVERYDR